MIEILCDDSTGCKEAGNNDYPRSRQRQTFNMSVNMFLLWVIFVNYVSCLSCFLVCSLQPCGYLLGKG